MPGASSSTGARSVRSVRFSNGGGNPEAHDGDRGGRGIGVKLYLDNGERTDLLGISVPVFTARTPEDFVEYVRLARRDPDTGQPDMAAIGAFLAAHPETAAALGAAGAMPPPASWLAVTYNGIHAFRWSAADGRAALGPHPVGSRGRRRDPHRRRSAAPRP